MTRRERMDYHPGMLTAPSDFSQDAEPPQSHREVHDRQRPVLYDAKERPLYRAIGYSVRCTR